MKTASRLFLTFSLLAFFGSMAFSQVASTAVPAKTPTKSSTVAPGKFVDNNKNGVCDNHEGKGANGQAKNFVDKNGDGKCDNCGASVPCKGSGNCGSKGQGCGTGKGQGKGNGCGQGHQYRNGCSNQGSTPPASQPKK